MPRPCCRRTVTGLPACPVFKPAGIPASQLEELTLTVDELEAIRLADLEGLYQEAAAERMGVSRPTLGRIVESARRKVAQALVEGKMLRIEGGSITMANKRKFQCSECQQTWELPFGTGRPVQCPSCSSRNIRRIAEDGEADGRGGRGHCRCKRQGNR